MEKKKLLNIKNFKALFQALELKFKILSCTVSQVRQTGSSISNPALWMNSSRTFTACLYLWKAEFKRKFKKKEFKLEKTSKII